MIPKIPKQRVNKSNGTKPFKDLVNYSIDNLEQVQSKNIKFENLINYETAHVNKQFRPKCIAARIHAITKIENASAEMDAVAAKSIQCKDPAYHFILSWPEFEKPAPEKMFDAAEHAIRSLGLGEHQYVIAIHADTDNMHCHIAVNRVNPVTFKSRNIEWSKKTLHMAARQSEIKHNWFHDNGIYIVQVDNLGNKTITVNQKYVEMDIEAGDDLHHEEDVTLPSWHDPDSLETWLKSFVTTNLKRDIKSIQSWYGLHAWLAQYGIDLVNSGGGGMRLTVSSTETGEILDVAASRGLRILKKSDLEERWGKFRNSDDFDFSKNLPDFTNVSTSKLQQGVDNVLKQSPDHGNPPPLHIINAQRNRQGIASKQGNRMPGMPNGYLDDGRERSEMLVPSNVHGDLDNFKTGKNNDVRRSGAGEKGNGQGRVTTKREEQKQYRAALRADLRKRYGQYRRYTRSLDTGYWEKLRDLKSIRKQQINELNLEKKEAISSVSRTDPIFLRELSLINTEYTNKKFEIESKYQAELGKLNEIRMPPLGWRVWLHEQAQLGDQAALSALRGIVYQAKRDAKYSEKSLEDDTLTIQPSEDGIDKDNYFRRLMKRLYEEEQRELAIRSSRIDMMRPHEIDAVIVHYKKIQWFITGNGNIEYSDSNGDLLFIDRGNRVTFDREIVSDDEIRLALLHASRKFGNQIMLTGTDAIFAERMARLAFELNLTVINPELQKLRQEIKAEATQNTIQNNVDSTVPVIDFDSLKEFGDRVIGRSPETNQIDPAEQLKLKVLSIVPGAKFEVADTSSNKSYSGTVFFKTEDNSGFVQHNGRDKFIIHLQPLTIEEAVSIDIKYKNNQATISKTKVRIKDI
jgi:hypothetical protein